MKWRRVAAMTWKEVIQIRRDPLSLLVILAMPLVQLFIFGYAVNLDVKHVPLCVYDQDATQDSQSLLKHFQATEYFRITRVSPNYADVIQHINDGACSVAVVLPARFAQNLHAPGGTQVQVLLDASDSNTASIGMAYAQAIIQGYASQLQINWLRAQGFAANAPVVTFQPRTWYNENLESMAVFVPGVVAAVMAVVGAFLTSLTIAREWERGTMEQLISTPVTALEVMLGKLLPYSLIGLANMVIAVLMAVFLFHVPLRGSVPLLFTVGGVFVVGTLAQGILISALARQQLLASQLAMISTFLPAFLLSGFAFAIANMPPVADAVAKGDRAAMEQLLSAPLAAIKAQGIPLISFHAPPATNFYRAHDPKHFGEDISASSA